ncbi:Crp/Fnr family transcriptional regulator [Pedobacter sp. V48]|uniref:Crp/Fnr family transcriptional regulator n=1 Tax=Pedobacter sp. V48 TaxID=509635 RepID=UPI0003E580DE|nr:Crp/Fnr family transcriptional regulator [Pedobacter sp. V48]ETZ24166.1 hypothetical protein N824_16635 [Pedobacter sp. V48]
MKPVSDETFEVLFSTMEMTMPISAGFKLLIRPLLVETEYKKGARILNFNQVPELIWFMISGLAREIKVNAITYSERTVWFWMDRNFLFTTPGFFDRLPSRSTIEILQDCRVAFISHEDWLTLKLAIPEADSFAKRILGANELLRLVHEDNLQNLNTKQRYLEERKMLNRILQYTKLQYVAEYMGMSADRLGKLRKRY